MRKKLLTVFEGHIILTGQCVRCYRNIYTDVYSSVLISRLGRALKIKDLLKTVMSTEMIEELERAYEEAFAPVSTAEDIEMEEDTEFDWLDKQGDLGVRDIRSRTTQEIKALLGLPGGPFPFFNKVIHDLGLWPEEIDKFDEFNQLNDEKELLKHKL